MRVSERFPRKYFCGDDLPETPQFFTIRKVAIEPVNSGEQPKPVVYFEKEPRGVVLNKTNLRALAEMLGDDTTKWVGHEVPLVSTPINFRGRWMRAIRVYHALPKQRRRLPPQRRKLPPKPQQPSFDNIPW